MSQILDAAGPVPTGPAADPVFGGIDVAKAELVWAVWSAAAGRIAGGVVANDPAGIADLGAQLTALGPARIVCEATGGLERAVVAGLTAAALPIRVVNPRRVRALAGALSPHAKTDPIDALLLARYAHVAAPPAQPAPEPRTAELKALFTRRRQVVAARVAETNQRASALPVVAASHDAVIAALTAELARLETAIAARITADPAMAAKATILRSVPGIGPGAALALLAGLPSWAPSPASKPLVCSGSPPPPTPAAPPPNRPTSPVNAPTCAPPSTWRCSPVPATTRSSAPSTSGYAPPTNRPKSPSSPASASSSRSSTPCSATAPCGRIPPPWLDIQHRCSRWMEPRRLASRTLVMLRNGTSRGWPSFVSE